MKRLKLFIPGLFLVLLLPQNLLSGEPEPDNYFPEIKGWKKVHKYPVYYPGTLWDYINGAADAYLGYDFIDLHIAEYLKGKKTSVKVEIYRHRTPYHAWGIYSMERAPEFNFVDVGAEGYQEGSVLNYTVDEYYVKIVSNQGGEDIESFILDLGKQVSDLINAYPAAPFVFDRFPASGRLPYTGSYTAKNFLGYGFFNEVFTVGYETTEGRYTLFLADRKHPSECRQLLEAYYAATRQEETSVTDHLVNDPYNGLVGIRWRGNVLLGVTGLKDEGAIKRVLDDFVSMSDED